MSRSIAPSVCPCRTTADAIPWPACCGRWHDGPQRGMAPSAEALMRSRYSAYVLDRLDYLLETWHPTTRPRALAPNPPGLKWLGLEVRRDTVIDADHATVEFVARSRLDGRGQRLHETSRFVRADGRWSYLDGEQR